MSVTSEQITPQPPEENQEEQKRSENSNTLQSNQTEEPQYFYKLILTQLIVILISTMLFTKRWFYIQYPNPRCSMTFDTYCRGYGRCSDNQTYSSQAYYREDLEKYQDWQLRCTREVQNPSCLFYFSLILFPSLLILQSVFRNYQLFKKRQKLFHYLQYPLMSLFVQVCTHIIHYTRYSEFFYHFRILLIFMIGNVSFFYLNQKYFKWQLEIKSTTQKLVNYIFILIFLKGMLDFISLNKSNWIPHLLVILYTFLYLLHLNTYLFKQNNTVVFHNQSLLCFTICKLKSLFVIQDVYQNLAETHFVIPRKLMETGFVGIIAALFLRDYIFSLGTLFILGGFLMFLVWDTSLVSTSSKLTLKDQYQAASLFFLDILMPIRNIFLVLLA